MAKDRLVKFPDDFSNINKDTADDIDREEIQKMIDETLSNPETVVIIQTGNAIVIKCDDKIVLSKEYYINKPVKKTEPIITDIDRNRN